MDPKWGRAPIRLEMSRFVPVCPFFVPISPHSGPQDSSGGPEGGHLKGGHLKMGFRSAVRT